MPAAVVEEPTIWKSVGSNSDDIASLIDFLREKGICYRQWGKNTSRTVHDLMRTLQEDEVELIDLGEKEKPLLRVNNAVVKVRHAREGKNYELYEESQYFHKSGKTLRRGELFDGIAETIMCGELPRYAAKRALSEELGQDQPLFLDPRNYHLSDWLAVREQREESRKWPGLNALYIRNIFVATIDDRLYKDKYHEAVYIDVEKGKGRKRIVKELVRTTTFSWKQIP